MMNVQTDIPHYVVMVVLSPELDKVVMLKKATGPKFLLGKMTYPGGHIEQGEHPLDAASREMLEETGLVVPREDFRHVATKEEPGKFELFVAARCDSVESARTCTQEEVSVVSVAEFLENFASTPAAYASDAKDIMLLSKVFLNHKV
jgi:8-oxo-dGTP pyrophosphatase MutT (NUDIX family)